jgi:ABC-type methionine transport system ATPase subunit
MIAMALACEPKLLIADEPTTALDATIQWQILNLLQKPQQQLGMAILLITHDLGVVAAMAGDIVVTYACTVVEAGPAGDVLYARAISIPRRCCTRSQICASRATSLSGSFRGLCLRLISARRDPGPLHGARTRSMHATRSHPFCRTRSGLLQSRPH